MPKVNTVDKARKSPGDCGKCGAKIKAGMPYRWAKGRYGPKKVRCPKCAFRPSDLTGSDKLSRLYSARESVEDVLVPDFDDTDAVRDAISSAVDEAREVASEYSDAAENMSATRDEMEEKSSQCESWADELEGVDVEEFEGKEEDREDWRETIRSDVQNALDSLEL